MEDSKISIANLLYEKECIEKCIRKLESLAQGMFTYADAVAQLYPNATPKDQKASSLDVTEGVRYIRNYLKMIDRTLSSTEINWPPV